MRWENNTEKKDIEGYSSKERIRKTKDFLIQPDSEYVGICLDSAGIWIEWHRKISKKWNKLCRIKLGLLLDLSLWLD